MSRHLPVGVGLSCRRLHLSKQVVCLLRGELSVRQRQVNLRELCTSQDNLPDALLQQSWSMLP